MRKNKIVRDLVAEVRLSKNMFIYPYFVVKGEKVKHEIAAMPNVFHFSVDMLIEDVREVMALGINKILLFGVGEEKSEDGHTSHDHNSIVAEAVRALKKEFGSDLYIVTDICLCAYTTHGHCGIIEHDYVQNDVTLDILAQMALTHAKAGADMVAPSDMMDGRVGAIRDLLDKNGFSETGLMSYSVKYASAYYGPFREAANSSPQKGDRKSYQMDFRTFGDSMREAILDEEEGADILMVKPALAYLDIIRALKENTYLPVACYNVSGEYSMVKISAKAGLINEQAIVMENMYAFARAGADIIITYHARDILEKGWM